MDDEASGLTHHRPAPTWLRVAGAISPFAESIGLLVWLTWLWNVDVARPFDNLLVWVLTAILVLALTIAIAFTAKSAGTAHNHAHQEEADGHRRPAAAHYRQRNVMLAVSGALGLLIGATMVVRGVQSLDQPAGYEVAIITVLSLVAGFALPGLTYAAKATDGSLYSRRRSALTGWLGQIEEERRTNLDAAGSLLDESAKVEQTVVLESLPRVARATEATVHAAVLPYEWAYVQVGVEDIALPPRPSVTGTDERGKACIMQSITCGLPHAPALDLQPFQDRWERIKALHEQRDELGAELEGAKAQMFPGTSNTTRAATGQMIPTGVQRRERVGHG